MIIVFDGPPIRLGNAAASFSPVFAARASSAAVEITNEIYWLLT
jgi:hypothetical protein